MKDLFLFSSLLDASHTFLIFSHRFGSFNCCYSGYDGYSFYATCSTRYAKFRRGFLEGVLSMGRDTMGSEKVQENIFLWLQLWGL